jgi:hypothetical protein
VARRPGSQAGPLDPIRLRAMDSSGIHFYKGEFTGYLHEKGVKNHVFQTGFRKPCCSMSYREYLMISVILT